MIGLLLVGSVLAQDGTPAAGVTVRLLQDRTDRPGEYRSRYRSDTNSEGEFLLHFPEAGRYHVHARLENGGARGARNLDLGIEEAPKQLELVLAGDGEIEGRLRDPAGRPVPGLGAVLRSARCRTGDPGELHECLLLLRRARSDRP